MTRPRPTLRYQPLNLHQHTPRWFPAVAALLVAALVLFTFQSALSAGFLNLDDDLYVTANEHVQHGLTPLEIGWAWTSDYLGYQIPMVWMSYMLDSDLFGIKPWGYHLTNVILHAVNAVLLLAFLRRGTGSTWRAALAAALWAVHPLRVESVAWVTERKDELAGLFTFLTLYAYVWHSHSPSRGRIGVVLVSYCLALLSKPPLAAALPLSVWLLDYWPLGRMAGGPEPVVPPTSPVNRAASRRQARQRPAASASEPPARWSPWRLALEKWPLLAVAVLAGVTLAIGMHQEAKFVGDMPETLGGKLMNAVVSPVRSLERVVWFQHLAVIYPLRLDWPPVVVAGSAAFLLSISGIVFWQRRRFPWLAVGWFWFVINYAPSLGLVQAGLKVAMGDRYTYIPSIGLIIMAVWSIPDSWVRTAPRRSAFAVAACGCVATLVIFTRAQLAYWQDSISLMTHAVAVTKNNWLAHHDLAVALSDRGDNAAALKEFNESQRINPDYPFTWENTGRLLNTMGRYADALRYANRAVELNPTSTKPRMVRETALMKLGQVEDAVAECDRILRVDPQLADAHNDIAFGLIKLGRWDEAIAHFRKALEIEPNNPAARQNLARAVYLAQHPPTTQR